MQKLSNLVRYFLNSPRRSFILCCVFIFIALVFDGSLFHLWRLYRDQSALNQRIEEVKQATELLKVEVQKARNPRYVEKQARERFDLVAEDELVFIFSSENKTLNN